MLLSGAACGLAGCAALDGGLDGRVEKEVFGRSQDGRPIRGTVLGTGPETYVLFGVIHGNEPLGAPLLERLETHLAANPRILADRRVVIIPVLNPDGLERGSRTNVRGIDLNRNFPASNWRPNPRHGDAPSSEAETRALMRVIRQFRPARILSIHSPLHCVNYDGPAEDVARAMATALGYPLRPTIGYSTPGSLGSYAGDDLLIPTITLELAPYLTSEDVWREAREALLAFLAHEDRGVGK